MCIRDSLSAGYQYVKDAIISFSGAYSEDDPMLAKEKCGQCWARFFCGGGCAANAEAFNGDISKPYDMECELERKRLECALAICAIEKLGAQAGEG